jgi:hypothetical protein
MLSSSSMFMTVCSRFKASHVLLTRQSPTSTTPRLELLVPLEHRRHEGLVLGVLGGMRDFHETDPIATASREAHEETGGAIDSQTVTDWLENRAALVWVQQAKSAVWVLPPDRAIEDLDKRIRYDGVNVEAEGFVWVGWRDVRAGAVFGGQKVGEFLALVLSSEGVRASLEEFEAQQPPPPVRARLPPHLEVLVREQARQVQQFEVWAARKDWARFHQSHYDWWTFPIDEMSKKPEFRVDAADVALLKAHPGFLESLRRACELLLLSWGWDLSTAAPIKHPGPNQAWADWPIRLLKMTRSSQIFGLKDCFDAGRVLARSLHEEGRSLTHIRMDHTPYFLSTTERCPAEFIKRK